MRAPGIDLAKAWAGERVEPPNDIAHRPTSRKAAACKRATTVNVTEKGTGPSSSELSRVSDAGRSAKTPLRAASFASGIAAPPYLQQWVVERWSRNLEQRS